MTGKLPRPFERGPLAEDPWAVRAAPPLALAGCAGVTAVAGSPLAGQAPGVVKIRLSGALPDIAAAASLLGCQRPAST